MARTKVLSAEEIKASLQRKEMLKETPEKSLNAVLQERNALEARVKELENKLTNPELQRGRLRPDEARLTLESLCIKHGVHPAEELLKMTKETDHSGNPVLTPDQRIKIFSELLGYQMPKLKSVESHTQADLNLTVVVKKFGQAAAEKVLTQPIEVEGEVLNG